MLQWAFVALFVTFGLSYVLPADQQPTAEAIGALVTGALFAVTTGDFLIRLVWRMSDVKAPEFLKWIESRLPSRRAGLNHRYQFNFIREKMTSTQLLIYRAVLYSALALVVIAAVFFMSGAVTTNDVSIAIAVVLLLAWGILINVNEQIEAKLWRRYAPEFEAEYEVIDHEKEGRRVQIVARRAPSDVKSVSLN